MATTKIQEKRSGADELRLIVSNLNATREGFSDSYTAEQLIQIGRMLLASEWDIYPDQWTARQVKEALKGRPPTWDDQERPTYDAPKPRRRTVAK